VLWNKGAHRVVVANGPGIIIFFKKEKIETCILIEVAIPTDRNVIQKEAQNKCNIRVYVQ
jgi:hypothetical protein